jgi:hypothetical protein
MGARHTEKTPSYIEMSAKAWYVLVMIGLLVVANAFMVMGYTNYQSHLNTSEAFMNYASSAAAIGSGYEAIGVYDNLKITPKHGMSEWREKAPNEPLLGPEVKLGPDNLFIFKNNQCKPECCGSSFSCGGGCVCTTPAQRDFINSRGGNRTAPTDSL